jgi:hypothetical protein
MQIIPAYPDLSLIEFPDERAVFLSSRIIGPALLKKVDGGVSLTKANYLLEPIGRFRLVVELKRDKAEKEFRYVGEGEGVSFFHCWYMACKFHYDFFENVSAYAINTPIRGGLFSVSFYIRKESIN